MRNPGGHQLKFFSIHFLVLMITIGGSIASQSMPPSVANFAKERLGFIICAILLGSIFVPLEPIQISVSRISDVTVDLSFILSMPFLLQTGRQFGPEVTFTYGPFGFLARNFVPATWIYPLLILRFALALLFIYCGIKHLAPQLGSRWFKLGFLTPFAFLFFLGWDQFFWISFSVFFFLEVTQKLAFSLRTTFALVCAMAVASLVKFNFLIISLVSILFACTLVVSKRTKTAIAITYASTLSILWLAAGQNLGNLGSWFLKSWDLSAGYTEAMSKGFLNPYTWTDLGLFIFATILALHLAHRASVQIHNPTIFRRLSFLTYSALILFIANKHAWGGNQLEQSACVLIFLLSAYCTKSKVGFILPSTAIFTLAIVLGRNQFWIQTPPNKIGVKLYEHLMGLPKLLGHYETTLEHIREKIGVPEVTGSVDSFPDNSGFLVAYPEFQFFPRPAYLSLNAHTPALLNANAHYVADKPLKTILFEVVPTVRRVHNRLPLSIDSLAIKEILTHFDLSGSFHDLLVFERRSAPRTLRILDVKDAPLQWGQAFSISFPNKKAALWIQVKIEPTFLGSLVGFLYKPPHVQACISTPPNGYTSTCHQVLPSLAKEGFFAFPHPNSTLEFKQWILGNPSSHFFQSTDQFEIKFLTIDSPSFFYKPQLELHASWIYFE